MAQADDNGTQEGSLNFTFPADGIYRLRVEETNRRGGPDMAYRVRVEPYQAGFELASEAEVVNAPQGGVFVVKVTAARRDYNGPITLGVEGAGEGCQVSGNVIPEGKPETTMSVTLGSNLTAGQIGTLKIVGTAKIGEADFHATAGTLVRDARSVQRVALSAGGARRHTGFGRRAGISAILPSGRRFAGGLAAEGRRHGQPGGDRRPFQRL